MWEIGEDMKGGWRWRCLVRFMECKGGNASKFGYDVAGKSGGGRGGRGGGEGWDGNPDIKLDEKIRVMKEKRGRGGEDGA